MAPRKRSSRPTKRSTGRSTGRKNSSGSSAPILALGAILGLGAFSLWATAQHKSPQAALTALFQRTVPTTTSSAPAKVEARQPAEKAVVEKKSQSRDYAGAVGPVPRPAALVAPAPAKPVQQAAIEVSKPAMATQKVAPPPPPPASARALPMPPRGTNTAAHSPSVIYAKAKLTIHKNAWDRSPAIGTVEKGREMRSYGKTGKWHRVVVPSTNIIGWVHEDQLLGGRNKPDSAQMMTTGSIAKKTQAPTLAAPVVQKARIQPPMAVGKKN
ncbi:MAG: hypothetical protein AAGC59_11105 [Brucella pseudogrignonensis]